MDRSRRYASSIDVARLAGVSQSAVSRTFTPGRSVSACTRAKVLDAARQLDFRPSSVPQVMLTGRSGIVALVVPEPESLAGLSDTMLQTLASKLREAGKQILLVPATATDTPDDVAAELSRLRVDAIVNFSPALDWSSSMALPGFRLPIVTLAGPESGEGLASITPDHWAAGTRAAVLLHQRGARTCAFAGNPACDRTAAIRLAAFKTELLRLGLDEPLPIPCAHTHGGGKAAAAILRDRQHGIDAVFCATDPVAFGVLDASRTHPRRRTPAEVMLVGFGNHAAAAWDAYDLTTFTMDPTRTVQGVLTSLEAMARSSGAPGTAVTIEARLIERRSTARRP